MLGPFFFLKLDYPWTLSDAAPLGMTLLTSDAPLAEFLEIDCLEIA